MSTTMTMTKERQALHDYGERCVNKYPEAFADAMLYNMETNKHWFVMLGGASRVNSLPPDALVGLEGIPSEQALFLILGVFEGDKQDNGKLYPVYLFNDQEGGEPVFWAESFLEDADTQVKSFIKSLSGKDVARLWEIYLQQRNKN